MTSLIEQGADLTVEDNDLNNKKTSLYYAVFLGYSDVAELLLSKGAKAKADMDWLRCEKSEKRPLVTALCACQQPRANILASPPASGRASAFGLGVLTPAATVFSGTFRREHRDKYLIYEGNGAFRVPCEIK